MAKRAKKAEAAPTEAPAHAGLPVSGYTPQSADNVSIVNEHKAMEEALLRRIDLLYGSQAYYDRRWLAIAQTHIEQGFMALNRAVFKPQRINLPGDKK